MAVSRGDGGLVGDTGNRASVCRIRVGLVWRLPAAERNGATSRIREFFAPQFSACRCGTEWFTSVATRRSVQWAALSQSVLARGPLTCSDESFAGYRDRSVDACVVCSCSSRCRRCSSAIRAGTGPLRLPTLSAPLCLTSCRASAMDSLGSISTFPLSILSLRLAQVHFRLPDFLSWHDF